MSSPDFAVTPVGFEALDPVGFVNGNGALLRPVVDGANYPASYPAPGAQTPAFYGGATLLDLTATSTDTVARDVLLYEGRVATVQGAGTGALSTTLNTIVRATGSWIAEGWKPGHGVILVSPAGIAEEAQAGIYGLVTAVSAGTLTLATNALTANAGLAAGTRVVRARPMGRAPVAIGQGTASTAPAPANLIAAIAGGLLVKTERKLGVSDMILAGLAAAATAGTQVSIGGLVARY